MLTELVKFVIMGMLQILVIHNALMHQLAMAEIRKYYKMLDMKDKILFMIVYLGMKR